ncbi:MAG TPA: twin-arginine translocase TatA/TatE family subunit [Candidatus Sulfotelmatobacter sp.]|nr:twin-arginine translocase TatA/TatE family subunit [Candidatus Sulfotelmatobacter sp.]
MFSIPHLVIIFVVVLVVFGPEKLPELARNIGKIMGEFRRATGDLQHTFEDHLRDIERESSLRHPPASPGSTIAPPAATAAQNTIAPPKTESTSAPGTVPSDAPHGWTVAPPNPPAGENLGTSAGSSAEAPGATQADVAHAQPDAVKVTQEPLASPSFANPEGDWGKQPDKGLTSAAGAPEPSNEKGSDGGIPN